MTRLDTRASLEDLGADVLARIVMELVADVSDLRRRLDGMAEEIVTKTIRAEDAAFARPGDDEPYVTIERRELRISAGHYGPHVTIGVAENDLSDDEYGSLPPRAEVILWSGEDQMGVCTQAMSLPGVRKALGSVTVEGEDWAVWEFPEADALRAADAPA